MALDTDFGQFWLQLGGVKKGLWGQKRRGRVIHLQDEAQKSSQDPPGPLQEASWTPQDPSKRPLGPLQGRSKRVLGTDFDTHFAGFWIDFGTPLQPLNPSPPQPLNPSTPKPLDP